MYKLIILTVLVASLSACTSTQVQTACTEDKLAPAIVSAGVQIAEQASPGSTADAQLASNIDTVAHAAAQGICASLTAPTPAATP